METVIVSDLVVPVEILPKLKEVGVTEISGSTPVPASEMVAEEFAALLETVKVPVSLPVAVGAKLTEKSKL